MVRNIACLRQGSGNDCTLYGCRFLHVVHLRGRPRLWTHHFLQLQSHQRLHWTRHPWCSAGSILAVAAVPQPPPSQSQPRVQGLLPSVVDSREAEQPQGWHGPILQQRPPCPSALPYPRLAHVLDRIPGWLSLCPSCLPKTVQEGSI